MEGQWPGDAAAQLESLQLLGEVADYLARLPINPMTHSLKQKIETHLGRPGASLHKTRIEQTAKDQLWRERLEAGECYTGSSRFTPLGLPVVHCLVVAGHVHLRSPAISHEASKGAESQAEQMVASMGRELVDGIDIKLSRIDASTSKLVAQNWPHHRHQFK
jgi:hypothetical protein